MEISSRGVVVPFAATLIFFSPSLSNAQVDKPNAPGVGIEVPATKQGSQMRLQSGEYSPISGGQVKTTQWNEASLLNTVTWTESFCSDIISDPTIDADIIRHAIGFENFPPGTVINDLDISVEFSPEHTWMSDVSIGFDSSSCGSPGSVTGCASILFDGDGDDGGPDVSASCTSSDDLGTVTFDDTSASSYAADCGDDGSLNNSTGNLP